jgi:hypothetical protein
MKLHERIRQAVYNGRLLEPFNAQDLSNLFQNAFAANTYRNYLPKHRKGNPGGYKEYFKRGSKLLRGFYWLI